MGGVAVAAAGLAWGLGEARAFTVRHVTVPVLSPGADDLRVLHISDLHVTPGQRKKLAWVHGLNELRPDLVVATGDFLSHARAIGPVLDALGSLLEVPGVFVRGSNDYYTPKPLNPFAYFAGPSQLEGERRKLPTEELNAGLTSRGWLDLDNARGELKVRGQEITFVGLDDPHLALDAMPAAVNRRGSLHVGVTHAPYSRALSALQDDGAHMIFAGHTHGGQVCVPGWGALVTNCDLDAKRAKGLHGWPGARPDSEVAGESLWLHVSAGLGTSPYAPVRFACRPEATLLTLTASGGHER